MAQSRESGFCRSWLRRTMIGLLGLTLLGGGALACSVLPEPKSPIELVDVYLRALRAGDVDRAVQYWNDGPDATEGLPPTRQRVRTYLESHREAYRRALADETWALREIPARFGIGVEVAIGSAEEQYVVAQVKGERDAFLIFAGPEDVLGLTGDNALIDGV